MKINDRLFSWFGTVISIKSGGVKLSSLAQASPLNEMMWSCKSFPHVSKVSALTYNRGNSVVIENSIILNIIQNTLFVFNLRDTEVVICIILVLIILPNKWQSRKRKEIL